MAVIVDGCATQAWLAAHMTLAVALRMMRAELPAVTNTREAAALLQQIVLQAHTEIMQVRQSRPCMHTRVIMLCAIHHNLCSHIMPRGHDAYPSRRGQRTNAPLVLVSR